MRSDKRYVLGIQFTYNRFIRASLEDLIRYAGYMGVKKGDKFPALKVARILTKPTKQNNYAPIWKLVRYFDTDQYQHRLEEAHQ